MPLRIAHHPHVPGTPVLNLSLRKSVVLGLGDHRGEKGNNKRQNDVKREKTRNFSVHCIHHHLHQDNGAYPVKIPTTSAFLFHYSLTEPVTRLRGTYEFHMDYTEK